jgi:hypothetical protein
MKITAWGKNVYTKIPITNSRGESCLPLIKELGQAGVKLNVTALLTLNQVAGVAEALNPAVPRWCRYLPVELRTRAWTRCRSCGHAARSCMRSRKPNFCGPARARC